MGGLSESPVSPIKFHLYSAIKIHYIMISSIKFQ
jgi:hypothetical protein